MQNTKAYIMLVCATLFWAGNFMIGKLAFLENIPPMSLVFFRWSLVWIILLPFTLKEIFMKGGTQSSMEYHIRKDENYYIQSGKLKVGIRLGRAENKSLILNKGDVFHIEPGVMHMRIALEDTIIIEWSNKDDDSDSNIVEDGKKYIFKEDN